MLKTLDEGIKAAVLCCGSPFAGFVLAFVPIYVHMFVLAVIKGALIFTLMCLHEKIAM